MGDGCTPCPEGRVRNEEGRCVMPEVTFSSLVVSLNNSALYHMGELPHPGSGRKERDLELAKHTIDTLQMLQEKTRGNLTEEEAQLLAHLLYELRLRYVRIVDEDAEPDG